MRSYLTDQLGLAGQGLMEGLSDRFVPSRILFCVYKIHATPQLKPANHRNFVELPGVFRAVACFKLLFSCFLRQEQDSLRSKNELDRNLRD